MVRYCFILQLFIFSFTGKVQGQCEPIIPPTANCETAPFICFHQVCFTTGNEPQTCCVNWCGNNTIINNPQFFSFTPYQPDVEIQIHVDDCTNGVALQSAILDACPWDNSSVISCDPGTPAGGTMVLVASGLIPSQTYWLLIDGSNGSECHYTFTNTFGIEFPQLPDTLDTSQSFPGDSVVCPGYQDLVLTTGPTLEGAYYLWTFGWNGDSILSNEPTTTINLEVDAPEGQWDICVRAFTGCDTTESVCFQVEIVIPTAVVKDTAIMCPEAFPFLWHGQIINGPGDYSATGSDEHLCSFDSTWTVLSYPDNSPTVIDTFVCSPQFHYSGAIFDQTGQYLIVLPGENVNGCDSMVELHLEIGASDQFIELVCENDEMVLQAHLIAQDESIDTVTFEWYSCSFDSLLSSELNLIPDTTGCFSLVVNSGLCVDTISSVYNNTPCEFNDECYFINSPTCAGVETLLTPVFQVPTGSSIHWLIDYPGSPGTYSGNTDSIYVTFQEPGSYPVSFTLQDSFQTYTCHANMHVNTSPEVSLCCDQFTCDSCAFITLSNFSDDPAVVSLNSGPPFALQGNAMMNVEICSPFPTDVVITDVESAGNGCPGTIVGDTVITINPLPPAFAFIIQLEDTLCANPNDLASFKWRNCNSAEILGTAPCFAPPATGCYCLEVANALGCTYETCTDFFISSTLFIAENEIRISPNPTSGLVQIELFQSSLYLATWQLTDLQGTNILEGALIEQSNELNFTSIPSGIYFLKINSKSNGALVRKIVIE
jgi:hypothetical protein